MAAIGRGPSRHWASPLQSGTCAARCRRCESPKTAIPRSPTTVTERIWSEPMAAGSISRWSPPRDPLHRLRYPAERSRRFQWHCRFPLSRMFRRTGPSLLVTSHDGGPWEPMECSDSGWLAPSTVDRRCGSIPQPGLLTGSPWCTARGTETSMSFGAMEQEFESWPMWADLPAHSVGRRTAARFGFPRKAGFGRCRRTDRDSTRCCRVGAPRPAVLRTLDSRRQILRFPAPDPCPSGYLPGNQLWTLDERRGLFRRASTEPVQLTSGPIRWNTPIPSKDGTKIFAQGVILRGELVRFDAQSSRLQPWLGGISAEFVTFSPDGKFVAYVTFPEGILWRANRDGSNPCNSPTLPCIP